MKKNLALLFALAFYLFTPLTANETSATKRDLYHDYAFEQERMVIDSGEIFTISSFDGEDQLACYDFYGNKHWIAKFHAKIISWEVHGNYIVIFSKDRGGYTTYLNLVDRNTGYCLWERR